MKKFFDRLRRWLIKKLGGYTERIMPIQPQKILAQISVSPLKGSPIDFKGYCESRVLEQLAWQLYQSGFILWESEYEPFTQKVNVSGTLYVVNEIEQHFKSRVV